MSAASGSPDGGGADRFTGRLLIPDRPQARADTLTGRNWRRAAERIAAEQLGTTGLYGRGFINLSLELFYSLPEQAPAGLAEKPEDWAEWGIPRADRAPALLLGALKGSLYRNTGQVQPLTVTRTLLSRQVLTRRFGADCARGCAVVVYSPVPPSDYLTDQPVNRSVYRPVNCSVNCSVSSEAGGRTTGRRADG